LQSGWLHFGLPKQLRLWYVGAPTFVLLREHQAQLTNWIEELKEGGMFTQIATDEYAKFLTGKLAATVQVSG
jgi:hypothetical protein